METKNRRKQDLYFDAISMVVEEQLDRENQRQELSDYGKMAELIEKLNENEEVKKEEKNNGKPRQQNWKKEYRWR